MSLPKEEEESRYILKPYSKLSVRSGQKSRTAVPKFDSARSHLRLDAAPRDFDLVGLGITDTLKCVELTS